MQGGGGEIVYISDKEAPSILGFKKASANDADMRALPMAVESASCDCSTTRYLAWCFVRNAFDDAWPWCAGSAGGCLFLGPAYFQCVGGGCAGAFIANTILQARDHYRNCLGF